MSPAERLHMYKTDYLDTVLLKIKRGDLKCGKYANRVKIDKNFDIEGKEFFTHGSESNDK